MRKVDPLLTSLAEPPVHFDSRFPFWVKFCLFALLTAGALLIDRPISAWVITHTHLIFDIGNADARHGDIARDLMMLEQFGQWSCVAIIVVAVALLDPKGRRKALAIAVACIATMLVTHLLKNTFGRTRPHAYYNLGLTPGDWIWGGPAKGFTKRRHAESFPSAHASAAFALASSLAWFYPRARTLFMTLALCTSAQRVLHEAHFLSDVIAGLAVGVGVSRLTLSNNLAGLWISVSLAPVKKWYMADFTKS